jgi:hypothetical protein
MKKFNDIPESSDTGMGIFKIRDIWEKCSDKAKNGSFTCPFCREVLKGLSAFGSHLKSHCT